MKRTNVLLLIVGVMAGLPMTSVAPANPIAIPRPPPRRPEPPPEPPALPEPPAVPETLTGTLAWKTIKNGYGSVQTATLQLITVEKKAIDLLPEESVRNSSQYQKFIGKTVEVKVMRKPVAKSSSQPLRVIQSITVLAPAQKPKL
jgi:hypothetical protein